MSVQEAADAVPVLQPRRRPIRRDPVRREVLPSVEAGEGHR